jgi:hypothetical protein
MLYFRPHKNVRCAEFDLLSCDRKSCKERGTKHGGERRWNSSLRRPASTGHVNCHDNIRKFKQQIKSRQISDPAVQDCHDEHEISKASDTCLQKLGHNVGTVAQNSQYVGPNRAPFNSRRRGGADDGVHGRPGNLYRANPHLVQSFERQAMRNPSRATASERNRYARATNL